MGKLSSLWKKLLDKFKALTKGAKIAIIAALITVLIAIGSLIVYSSQNKYGILFSDLEAQDIEIVMGELEEKKVEKKIKGNTILVDKKQVDELRLSLAPKLSSGSKGFELMEEGSFGMSDEEFSLKKQRMIQGELEKTIKSFPQVKNARVHITSAKDSVFVEDKKPGKAAVILDISGKIDVEQVKSIISLVSGSTENIPKENVEVIDQNMNLLSNDVEIDEKGSFSNGNSVKTQRTLEEDYEKKLQKEIVALLEPVIGKDRVRANINVDLDFDSKQKTEIKIDPNKVIVSQETIKDVNKANGGTLTEGPVDNNMSNTVDSNGNGNSSSKEQQKTNYESGKTETKTISAPGEVKRITASVVIDGKFDNNTSDVIKETVKTAIGVDDTRGDKISILAMEFDPNIKALKEKEIEDFNNSIKIEKRNNIIKTVGFILLLIIGFIVIVKFLKNRKNNRPENRSIDIVLDDDYTNEPRQFEKINFEAEEDEKTHLERELKNYAKEKPDQVADIVKSWLKENER